jgi:hypothetical protein
MPRAAPLHAATSGTPPRAEDSSATVIEVVRLKDLLLGSRGTRRADASGLGEISRSLGPMSMGGGTSDGRRCMSRLLRPTSPRRR